MHDHDCTQPPRVDRQHPQGIRLHEPPLHPERAARGGAGGRRRHGVPAGGAGLACATTRSVSQDWPATPQYEYLADTIWPQHRLRPQRGLSPRRITATPCCRKFPILRYAEPRCHRSAARRAACCIACCDVPGRPTRCMRSACTWACSKRIGSSSSSCCARLIEREVPAEAPLIVAGDFNDWRARAHEHPASARRLAARCSCTATAVRRGPFPRAFRCCGWTASMCATRVCTRPLRAAAPALVASVRPRAAGGGDRSRVDGCRRVHAAAEVAGSRSAWHATLARRQRGRTARERRGSSIPRVFEAIAEAQHEVLIETFILFEDKVGLRTAARADRGGTPRRARRLERRRLGLADLSPAFIGPLHEAGVRVRAFDPAPRCSDRRLHMFRRMHRKIVVVDGARRLRRRHQLLRRSPARLRARGQAGLRRARSKGRSSARHPQFAHAAQVGSHAAAAAARPAAEHAGRTRGRCRGDARHARQPPPSRRRSSAIIAPRSARRGSEIIIANAYFFPGYRLLKAMRRAARRGVDVRLILQGQPDMPIVKYAAATLHAPPAARRRCRSTNTASGRCTARWR